MRMLSAEIIIIWEAASKGAKETYAGVRPVLTPKHGCHLRSTVSSWPYCPYLQRGERKIADLWSCGAGVRLRWLMDAEPFAKGCREGLFFCAWPLSLLVFKEALLSMVHKCQLSIQRMGHRGDHSLSSPSLASKETGFFFYQSVKDGASADIHRWQRSQWFSVFTFGLGSQRL